MVEVWRFLDRVEKVMAGSGITDERYWEDFDAGTRWSAEEYLQKAVERLGRKYLSVYEKTYPEMPPNKLIIKSGGFVHKVWREGDEPILRINFENSLRMSVRKKEMLDRGAGLRPDEVKMVELDIKIEEARLVMERVWGRKYYGNKYQG